MGLVIHEYIFLRINVLKICKNIRTLQLSFFHYCLQRTKYAFKQQDKKQTFEFPSFYVLIIRGVVRCEIIKEV